MCSVPCWSKPFIIKAAGNPHRSVYKPLDNLTPASGRCFVCTALRHTHDIPVTTVVLCRSRVSSGSNMSDYELDDRANGVRSPTGAQDFSSSLCIQTDSGAHPASCTMGTGSPFPGGKARPGRDADHSPLSSDEVVNE
jgi:hypothetical protein